jgi:predicted transcriptional regulator of viral defense system
MTSEIPDRLPPTFTAELARELGVSRQSLRTLLSHEVIERIGRGIYRRLDADPADDDLIEIAVRAPQATLCLETVLCQHDLSDLIPSRLDVALPRGTRFPVVRVPVAWHAFDPATFHIGRELMQVDPVTSIGTYSPERCIVDTVRLQHQQGPEVAYQAIRRYLGHRGSRSSAVLDIARHWPGIEAQIQTIMEIIES